MLSNKYRQFNTIILTVYTKLLLIISLSILALIFSNSSIELSYSINIDPESAATKLSGVDKFGIKEIYPTKEEEENGS